MALEEITSPSSPNVYQQLSRSGFPITRYETEIVFRYTVGGREYTSRSTNGYQTARYSDMKRIADTYVPGTHHLIRYHPKYSDTVLFNVGYNYGFFIFPITFGGGGLLFTVIGVVTLKGVPAARSFEKAGWVGSGRPCQACGQELLDGHRGGHLKQWPDLKGHTWYNS